MKKVLFVLLSLLIMAIAVSCDSSVTVSADAVLNFSEVELKAGDRVVIDVTCGSKTMPSLEFTITDPSQKAPKFTFKAIRRASGTIDVEVYRQYEPVTKSETEGYIVAVGSVKIEEFAENSSYSVAVYPTTYSITYDANGATSGAVPAVQAELIPGDDVVLVENTGNLEKTNKAFSGWNTEADGSGVSYAAGSTVTGGFGSDTTLYAEWSSKYNPEDYVMMGYIGGEDGEEGINRFQVALSRLRNYKQTNITSIEFYKTENVPSDYELGTNVVNLGDYAIGDARQGNIKGYLIGTDKLVIVGDRIYGNPNCSYLFGDFISVVQIKISDFDTSNVTDMSWMFYSCKWLPSIDLSNLDTSNVTDMESMFGFCLALPSLDLSSFDTSDVEYMDYMFYYCEGLSSIDLSNFDISNVTDLNCMFKYCPSLTSLDLTGFKPSEDVYSSSMFEECGKAGTTITINPAYKPFYDTTELGSSHWSYSSGTYTHE